MYSLLIVGRIGFEQEKYDVNEDGFLQIFVRLLEPNDTALIDPDIFAFIFAETIDGTAIGESILIEY